MANLPRRTSAFKGINNVTDGIRLNNGWLSKADNVEVTDAGGLVRREGFSKVSSAGVNGCYSTKDFARMYVASGGGIHKVNRDLSLTEIASGVPTHDMRWAEINSQVFYCDGDSSGIITPGDEVLPWAWVPPSSPTLSILPGSLPAGNYQVSCTFVLPDGRETGACEVQHIYLPNNSAIGILNIDYRTDKLTIVNVSPADSTVLQIAFVADSTSMVWDSAPTALGAEATTTFMSPLPKGGKYPTFWEGRAYVAEFLPNQDASVVWFSEPLGFHLFNMRENFIMVPGEVIALAPHTDGLIIGTKSNIYSYNGESFKTEAEYGVVPGRSWTKDEKGEILLWTCRGLCSALPFNNLTHRQISVRAGAKVGAALMQRNGYRKFLAYLHEGGDNFNQRNN